MLEKGVFSALLGKINLELRVLWECSRKETKVRERYEKREREREKGGG